MGEVKWKKVVYEGKLRLLIYIKNSFVLEMLVIDGECVYCYFGN